MMNHKTVSLVLLAMTVVHPSTSVPLNLFAGIANFLEGIRYVPPQTGIFSATAATTTSTTAKPQYIVEKKEVIVFNESGWLQPAGSQHRYLMSSEPMDWFTAKYWCIGEGGFLAEIREKEQQEEVEQLVVREGERNYWLGLEHGWDRWYTSRTSTGYKGWASFPSGDQDRCAAMLAREGYRWENWNCHDQYEQQSGREFRALCQKDVKKEESQVEEIKYTATKNEDRSNITTCSMVDIRLQGGGWIDRYEGVRSAEKCHALCLAKAACRFWTWRGDNRGKRCFLKEKEGKTVSKPGAFSGTTSHNLGCNQPLATRESRMETCSCVPVENLVKPGYINPRLAPDVSTLLKGEDSSKPDVRALLNGDDSSKPTPRLAPDVGAILNGDDDTNPYLGRIVNGRPDIGNLLNGRQDTNKPGSGRVCPSGYALLCTDQDEQNEGDILLSSKATTSRPDFHPNYVQKVTTNRPASKQLHITACLVHDVRLSGSSVVSTLKGVTSYASCHAHCLSNPLCSYWTWGGNIGGDKCLLRRSEGRVVRKAGAAAGTVRKGLNCHHPLISRILEKEVNQCTCQGRNRQPKQDLTGIVNPRESPRGRIVNIDYGCPPCQDVDEKVEKKEVEVVCSCRFDPTQDLVGNGKINPRKLQQGRIVNEKLQQGRIVNEKVDKFGSEIECPAGFKLDCDEFEGSGSGLESFLELSGPELSSIDYYSAPRLGRSQKDSSAVSFPNA